jgi:hypothetical protein
VTVLTALLKAIAWEIYSTVQTEFNERRNRLLLIEMKEMALEKRKQMVEEVRVKAD